MSAFVKQVWSELIIAIYTEPESTANVTGGVEVTFERKVKVLANVIYSYDVVAKAARLLQARPEWREQSSVQNLKFSPKWISDFLKTGDFSRIKITRTDKPLPSRNME